MGRDFVRALVDALTLGSGGAQKVRAGMAAGTGQRLKRSPDL